MSNERSLKEALEAMVSGLGLREKLDEQELRAAWEDLAGRVIAKHTTELRLRKGVLTVEVDSAPLRQELTYMRGTLIELIDRRFGRRVVEEIRLR